MIDEDDRANRDQWALPEESAVLEGRGQPASLFDPNERPMPKTCACGEVYEWDWWKGRTVSSRVAVRGRWCPPPIPCERCQVQAGIEAGRREMARRQDEAGIARTHRPYLWALTVIQDHDEPWVDFAWRTKDRPDHIGIARADMAAAKTVSTWEPKHGSLFVYGPVGSGKSLYISARLSDLIAPTESGDAELTEEQLVNRGLHPDHARRYVQHGLNKFLRPGGLQLHHPMLIDEEEVVRRVELAWKGDQVPLLQIARQGILAYDDMGTVLCGGSSPKARELARTCIARLLDLRWREHRPLIVTSNRSLDEICEALDRKTADRLRELIKHQVPLVGVPRDVVKAGHSWRNLPPRSDA